MPVSERFRCARCHKGWDKDIDDITPRLIVEVNGTDRELCPRCASDLLVWWSFP